MKESGYINSNTLKTFLTSTVSISDLTRTGSKQIFDILNKNDSKIVLKNNKVVVALISTDRYQELLDKEEDLRLIQIAIARKEQNLDLTYREEFIEENGIDEAILKSLPEIEME